VSETFRIVPAGDSAVVVEFEARIDPVVNARAIALADAVQSANLAGVRDVVPTYRSVAIYFDPLRTDYDALLKRLSARARHHIRRTSRADSFRVLRRRLWSDLDDVAKFAGGAWTT
jgi:allophanate hydrolase subunit 1